MDEEKIYRLLDKIEITENNKDKLDEIRQLIQDKNYIEALNEINELSSGDYKTKSDTQENEEFDEDKDKENVNIYPKKLSNPKLEETYIGLLLSNPKLIVKYYILFENCYFEDETLLDIYKSILYTESAAYTPEIAKRGYNFANGSPEAYAIKHDLKEEYGSGKYDIEKVYVSISKLFTLRKSYIEEPLKEIQDKIVEIVDYELYNKMSVQEVKNAITQVSVTQKFKQAVLNNNLTDFLEKGDNNLTNGLSIPFPILSSTFKGLRKGETTAFAMPSNAGKSRFTIEIATYVALVHNKKVLVISNEMSEEKMKLCLITTILNNKDIQKIHGHKIKKSETELLEFKFRPDDPDNVEVDENGFCIQGKDESKRDFVQRLLTISSEFNQIVEVTNWAQKQLSNSIYFINITDHTNDELQKVIMNYYYKEKIEYVFYDTLKTDTANIGNAEEIKRTATILSNLAQNFEMFIFATLQLLENTTKPINLTINDLAVSKTVKEVLDTLCLIKQIPRDELDEYQYSLKEVDTTFYPLKKYDDPDVRYYACVVDKNRAGAKPKVVFKLNLAYNEWEELGYLSLKNSK